MTEKTPEEPEEQTDEKEEQQPPEDLEDLDPEDIDMEDLPPGLVPPRYLVGYVEPAVTIIGMVLLTLVWYGTRNHLPQSLTDRNRFYAWVALNFVLLLVVPVIIIKLIFKRSLSDFGLQFGRVAIWWRYFVGFLIITVPVLIISSRFGDFQAYYSRYSWATENHMELAMFAGGWLVYFFSWEFFFRGFWLFGLAPSLGAFSIFVQMVPFVMMHFSKPEAESFAAIIAGIALGVMSYRSKSIIGCWLLHWLLAMVMYWFVFTSG